MSALRRQPGQPCDDGQDEHGQDGKEIAGLGDGAITPGAIDHLFADHKGKLGEKSYGQEEEGAQLPAFQPGSSPSQSAHHQANDGEHDDRNAQPVPGLGQRHPHPAEPSHPRAPEGVGETLERRLRQFSPVGACRQGLDEIRGQVESPGADGGDGQQDGGDGHAHQNHQSDEGATPCPATAQLAQSPQHKRRW